MPSTMLGLHKPQFTHAGVLELKALPRLTALKLPGPVGVRSKVLTSLAAFPALTSYSTTECKDFHTIHSRLARLFLRFPHLRRLHVGLCSFGTLFALCKPDYKAGPLEFLRCTLYPCAADAKALLPAEDEVATFLANAKRIGEMDVSFVAVNAGVIRALLRLPLFCPRTTLRNVVCTDIARVPSMRHIDSLGMLGGAINELQRLDDATPTVARFMLQRLEWELFRITDQEHGQELHDLLSTAAVGIYRVLSSRSHSSHADGKQLLLDTIKFINSRRADGRPRSFSADRLSSRVCRR